MRQLADYRCENDTCRAQIVYYCGVIVHKAIECWHWKLSSIVLEIPNDTSQHSVEI